MLSPTLFFLLSGITLIIFIVLSKIKQPLFTTLFFHSIHPLFTSF